MNALHFYIDSADRDEVLPLLATGLFTGVTTNPAILEKAGLTSMDLPHVIHWATEGGASKVFVQVWGTTPGEMIELGTQFRRISDRVVIKVPYSPEGIEAATALSETGEVLVTAIHRGSQVLPVALAGATYLAPFVGRMDAAGRDGMREALTIQQIVSGLQGGPSLLAGSLRTPEQVAELAAAGVTHFTMAPAVWRSFFDDDVTEKTVANFQQLASA